MALIGGIEQTPPHLEMIRKTVDSFKYKTIQMVIDDLRAVDFSKQFQIGDERYSLEGSLNLGTFVVRSISTGAERTICPIEGCTSELRMGEMCCTHYSPFLGRNPADTSIRVNPTPPAMDVSKSVLFSKYASALLAVVAEPGENWSNLPEALIKLKYTGLVRDEYMVRVCELSGNVRITDRSSGESFPICREFPECMQVGINPSKHSWYCDGHASSADAGILNLTRLSSADHRREHILFLQQLGEEMFAGRDFCPSNQQHWNALLKCIRDKDGGFTRTYQNYELNSGVTKDGRFYINHVVSGDRTQSYNYMCQAPLCLRRVTKKGFPKQDRRFSERKNYLLCSFHSTVQHAHDSLVDLLERDDTREVGE